MQVQVDQSIKIEQTSRDTVIAFSNHTEYAILISCKVKRRLQELFRQKGQPSVFIYKTLAAGIVLLLQKFLPDLQRVVIDQEYTGKERMIRDMIFNILAQYCNQMPEIVFEQIGKKAKAHGVAYHVTNKERKPDRSLKFNEIKRLVFP